MKQLLFVLPGGIPIFGYGLMLCLAFLSTMGLSAWLAKREKLNPEHVLDLAFWVFLPGILGARVCYFIEYPGEFRSFADLFKIWNGGIVLYGGMIGGTIGGLSYWRLKRFPLLPMLDVVAPSIALGIALGRFGCFLNGCCYGDPCELPWAVSFPYGSMPWAEQLQRTFPPEFQHAPFSEIPEEVIKTALIQHPELRQGSLPIHPTQLYSSIDGLISLILLLAYFPLRRRDGEVIALLLVTFPITRILIENLRDDEGPAAGGMTIAQILSIGFLMTGVALWAYVLLQPKRRFADEASQTPSLTSTR